MREVDCHALADLSERIFAITNPEYRINRQIRAREVRLINDETKENLGVVSLSKALELAETAQLDLVEVAPEANPPVCRIMDFGKFLYERQRRERKARKQQKVVEVKEIRLTPSTDDHHLGFKVRDARRWIQEGMKVRISIKFKGRQNLHPELGRGRLQAIAEDLKDVATVELGPLMEGTTMLIILTPQTDKSGAKEPQPAQTAPAPKDKPQPDKGQAQPQAQPQSQPDKRQS